MAITLTSRLPNAPEVYYTEAFRQMIEDHLSYLKSDEISEYIEISDNVAYKHQGDLTGALHEYNVPDWQHWIIMRMNGLDSMQSYSDDMTVLKVPHRDAIQRLMKVHRVSIK